MVIVEVDRNPVELGSHERGFEKVNNASDLAKLPTRATNNSAGYDFYSIEDVVIKPNESHVFKTDIKAYMCNDEYLSLHVRSSIGIKKNLHLLNTTGIIDSDYYSNPNNDGNILIGVRNYGTKEVEIKAGERIAQGIFAKYLTVDDDVVLNKSRSGGIGSSGV